MDHSQSLGTDPIHRLLLRYSIPAVIGMIVQVLYTLVDAMFIGHFVGENGLAAVTLVFPISVFSTGFGLLVGVGSCSCIALLLGQRRLEEAEKTLGNAFVLLLWLGLLTAVSLLPLGYLFITCSDTSTDIQGMAWTFLLITITFSVLPGVTFGLNNIIRVQGNPHIAMWTLLIGAILNTLLNPLFVGFFRWGVAGSAWATVLSQAVAAVWVLFFFNSQRSLLRLRWACFRLKWSTCKPILLIGLAPFLTQTAASIQGMILMGQLAFYGNESALAVWGVIYRTALVVFMVVLGIYQGAQPIIGYNYGARQFDRVRQVLNQSIGVATVWCVSVLALVLLFPLQLVTLFTPLTPALQQISASAVRWSLGMMGLMGFQVISSHYFQAVGKPRLSIFLSLTRQVIFLIPAILFLPKLLIHYGQPGIMGVWMSFALADFMSFLLTFYFYHREIRALRKGQVDLSLLNTEPILSESECLPPPC